MSAEEKKSLSSIAAEARFSKPVESKPGAFKAFANALEGIGQGVKLGGMAGAASAGVGALVLGTGPIGIGIGLAAFAVGSLVQSIGKTMNDPDQDKVVSPQITQKQKGLSL